MITTESALTPRRFASICCRLNAPIVLEFVLDGIAFLSLLVNRYNKGAMSCLFNAIGRSVDLSGREVRRQIVNYMIIHTNDDFNGWPIKNWVQGVRQNEQYVSDDEYILNMKRDSTWGGSLELMVAGLLYGRNIVVHYGSKTIEFINPNQPTITTHLIWTGSHYEYDKDECLSGSTMECRKCVRSR